MVADAMARNLHFLLPILALSCSRSQGDGLVGFVDAPVFSLAAPVSGLVASVEVHEGDHVSKGQVLAQLDARERQAMVDQATAALDRARAGLQEAQANLRAIVPTVRGAGADVTRASAVLADAQRASTRAHQLLEGGATSQAEVDSVDTHLAEASATLQSLLAGKDVASGRVAAANAAVDDANAAVRTAEAALKLASVQLSEATITAPCDGIVVDRNLEPGAWASPGTAVLTVEDTSRLWVRVDVDESRLDGLALGTPAEVTAVAVPDQRFKAHVLEVGAEADFALNRDVKRGRPDLRTFRVRVGLDEGRDVLRPGMTAEVLLSPAGP